jgi:hypothetical protein
MTGIDQELQSIEEDLAAIDQRKAELILILLMALGMLVLN